MHYSKNRATAGYGTEEVTPGGFVSLMDLYENNYLRLRRLIPHLESLPDRAVSHREGCLSLHVAIIERSRFTTTLRLTYLFDDHGTEVAEPDLTVRVYHDANQVEVLTGHLRHGRLRYDHIPEMAIPVKWKINRFLYKWLGYCLYLGHSFDNSPSSRKLPEPVLSER